MPIIKSQKKSLRQDLKRKKINVKKKNKIKDLLKQVKNLVSLKKNEEAKKLLPQIYKALDKAVKTNVIKKNTASRKKSRITKLLNPKSKIQTVPNQIQNPKSKTF